MSNRLRHVAASSVLIFLCRPAIADVVQLPIFYTADMVRELGGSTTRGGGDLPAGVDLAGRMLVSQGDAAAHDANDPHGLPDNGVVAVPGGTIQLGPYNSNNALRIGTFG